MVRSENGSFQERVVPRTGRSENGRFRNLILTTAEHVPSGRRGKAICDYGENRIEKQFDLI